MSDSFAFRQSQSLPLPPQVPGLPVVGNLPHLIWRLIPFLDAARARHGDIFRVRAGPSEIIALCHPRHVQHVLTDHARKYGKGGAFWDSMRTFMGNGLPVSEGSYWLRQRRMIQPAFHQQRLASLADKMVETMDEILTERWVPAARSGEPFNASQAFTYITMQVLARTMFGTGLTRAEEDQAAQALVCISDYSLRGIVTQPLPSWAPVPGKAAYRAAVKTIDEVVLRMIARSEQDPALGDTLVSLMHQARDAETGERMTTAQVRDEAVALFGAGYETTSLALAWAFHFLTQLPQFTEPLHAEVDEILGKRPPAAADLHRLPYARGVLQETLRLNSPAFWVPRTSCEEDEIDGYRIPSNTLIGVLVYFVHRNAEIWEDPERFDPERFAPERVAGRARTAWFPFGSGQRQCIGKEFSLMEGQLLLARIAQRFRITAISGRVAEPRLGITFHTRNGVWVKLSLR